MGTKTQIIQKMIKSKMKCKNLKEVNAEFANKIKRKSQPLPEPPSCWVTPQRSADGRQDTGAAVQRLFSSF